MNNNSYPTTNISNHNPPLHKRTNGGTLKVHPTVHAPPHQWRRRNHVLSLQKGGNNININNDNPGNSNIPSAVAAATTTATNPSNGNLFNAKPPHRRGPRTFGIFNDWTRVLDKTNEISNVEESLHCTLQQRGVYESPEGLKLRTAAVENLCELLQQWNKTLLIQKQQPQQRQQSDDGDAAGNEEELEDSKIKSLPQNSSGDCTTQDPLTFASKRTCTAPVAAASIKLLSFGSYRLGVHSPHADLDLLALCPSYISKYDFFHSFVEVLRQDSSCTAIHPVAKAYTPVIKFQMGGIPIDLLFVRLVNDDCLMDVEDEDKQQLIEHDLFQVQDEMLQGLDEPSSRSLNGVRVAQYLLSILSSSNNYCTQTEQKHSFRIVLRTVKEWAKVHGLYSNVLGFLGGINWAILVAWVCKRNPDASIPLLLKIFFHTFARWRWPKPVILAPIMKNPPQGVAALTIWDPANNPRDRAHIMPIITPCYPSMNSSYNVSLPQLRRIREELYRADKIMDQIASGDLQWSELFKDNNFFMDHVHYLQIKIISQTQEDHHAWFGLCESRLRILIAGLESGDHGTHAYPFAKFFTKHQEMNDQDTQYEESVVGKEQERQRLDMPPIATYFFIALRFAHGIESVDLIGGCSEFVYSVNSWEGRKGGMDLQIDHVLQHDLPTFVFESDSVSKDVDGKDKNPLSCTDDVVTSGTNARHHQLRCNTLLRDMISPDDCLASPLKKTKIGKA